MQLSIDTLTPGARKWISDNPEAWGLIVTMARNCVARRKRFGMRWLIEVARFEMTVKRDKPYRLNNNVQRDLAEELRRAVPGAADFMEVRER